jgi:hypothetical protein
MALRITGTVRGNTQRGSSRSIKLCASRANTFSRARDTLTYHAKATMRTSFRANLQHERMPRRSRHARLAWALEEPKRGGLIQLRLWMDADFHPDSSAAAVEEARRLTHKRSGGWKSVVANVREPLLPWHPDLSAAEHSWIWIKLLRHHAVQPDLKAPTIIGKRSAPRRSTWLA